MDSEDFDHFARPWIGPPSAKNQQDSPLLRLPRELRNRIYEELSLVDDLKVAVLANEPDDEDEGRFHFFVYDGTSDYSNMASRPLNPLKHTCRQLYLETSDLRLDFDELVFFDSEGIIAFRNIYHTEYESATQMCARYLRSCSPSKKAMLRTIEVHERPVITYADESYPFGLDHETMLELCEFCTEYPDVKMKITFHMVFCGDPLDAAHEGKALQGTLLVELPENLRFFLDNGELNWLEYYESDIDIHRLLGEMYYGGF